MPSGSSTQPLVSEQARTLPPSWETFWTCLLYTSRAGELPAEEAKQLAEERAEAKRQQAEAERARREAVEQERAAREAERAKRAEKGGPAAKPAAVKPQAKKVTNNPFESLASQIESEKERVAREAAERKARARAAAMAKEVAKKQAVEEALRNRNSKGSAHKPAAAAPKRQAPVLGARKSSFDSLLSQIESEKQRIEKQKAEQPARGADANKQQRGARKHGKKGMHVEQHVPELEQQASGEDRYAQMAVKAEELQRDKVLAEARAAVAAANSHEGEGRRKKRKQKREAEARERMEMEAIERGLDPSLVLDDSVVEIPQGSTCLLYTSDRRFYFALIHACILLLDRPWISTYEPRLPSLHRYRRSVAAQKRCGCLLYTSRYKIVA